MTAAEVLKSFLQTNHPVAIMSQENITGKTSNRLSCVPNLSLIHIFSMEFAKYEQVPANVEKEIIEKSGATA